VKRRTVHLVFGVLGLCCAGAALERGLRLQRTQALNAEVARIAAAPASADATPAPVSAPRQLQLPRPSRCRRPGHTTPRSRAMRR